MRKLFSALGLGTLGALIGAVGGCLLFIGLAGLNAAQEFQTSPSLANGPGWVAFDLFWKLMFVLVVGLIGAIGGAAILGIPSLLFSTVWAIFKQDKKSEEKHDQNS